MDMGIVRAVGMGSVSLRTVVCVWRQLVLVARAGGRVSGILPGVGAGVCFVLWFRRACRIRNWIRSGLWFRTGGLGGDRTWGLLSSVVRGVRPALWSDRVWGASGRRVCAARSARLGASLFQHRTGGHQRASSRRLVFDGIE